MNPDWRSFLQESGATFDAATPDVLHFGDATGELLAAQGHTVVTPLTHLAILECGGEEAKTFLHNQLTSDINHLGVDAAQHSAWCTAKGRMLASFLIWRSGDAYRLALAAELAEAVLKRLVMYRLRSKADLADITDKFLLIGVAGAQMPAALAAAGLPLPETSLATAGEAAYRVIRLDDKRVVIAVGANLAADLWRKLATVARPAGIPAWRWLDVQAGLPLVTGATREEFVPQMADFEKIGGVSFHKGCYPGQEVVARTQYLGKVKRHLYRVVSGTPLQAGDDLHSPDNPDQAAGKVVTAAPSPAGGYEALAVVQFNYAENLHLGSREGPKVAATAVNS